MGKSAFRVGVFDSGVGGLTVLDACVKLLPGVSYYYYGDNLRAPYGGRGEEEILRFLREAFDWFSRKRMDAVVLACNTATAVAVNELRKEYSFPIVGLEPAVKPAAAAGGEILVLVTEGTANSNRFRMLAGRTGDASLHVFACPHLAGAIERHFALGEPLLVSAHLPDGRYDGVVLGCTHYSFFREEISSYYSAPVYDGASGAAKRLSQVLGLLEIGMSDHHLTTTNPNKSLRKKHKNGGKGGVKFVGKSRNLNKSVYLQTFVLEKSEKK